MNERVPVTDFTFHHHQPIQIRFNDIDLLGHLNNALYFQFMDLAKVSYFKQFTGDRYDWSKIGLVVAHIDVDFIAPTYINDHIEVLTAVASISNKSLVLSQRVVEVTTGEVKCVANTVMVNFDPASNRSVPISDEWRKRLSDYEGRTF